jgi:GMP synthase (glutamine-hydrolysing)
LATGLPAERIGMTGKALFVHHGAYSSLGLIAERAEQRGFEVVPAHSPQQELDPRDFALVVLLGSPSAVYDDRLPWLARELAFVDGALAAGVPVLGICFGAQLLSARLGGIVGPATEPELGWTTVQSGSPELIDPGPWFEMHEDAFTLPPGAVELARNDHGLQAFGHGAAIGVQFHPEVDENEVETWLAGAPEFVDRAGVDPSVVMRETREVMDDARRRAHCLFDRVWRRLGS